MAFKRILEEFEDFEQGRMQELIVGRDGNLAETVGYLNRTKLIGVVF